MNWRNTYRVPILVCFNSLEWFFDKIDSFFDWLFVKLDEWEGEMER